MESCAGGPRDATAGKQAVGLVCIHSDFRSPPPRRNPDHTERAASRADFPKLKAAALSVVPKAALKAQPVLTFVNRHLVRCNTGYVHPATLSLWNFTSAQAFVHAVALGPVPSKLVIRDIGDL